MRKEGNPANAMNQATNSTKHTKKYVTHVKNRLELICVAKIPCLDTFTTGIPYNGLKVNSIVIMIQREPMIELISKTAGDSSVF